MKKHLQTAFSNRQYMLSRDFEIYYYQDTGLKKVALHTHDYYEFYFFLEGDVSIQVGENVYQVESGDFMLIPPHYPHRPIIRSTAVPYRRFVFWISRQFCENLTAQSQAYGYLIEHVEQTRTFLFHNSPAEFNTLQYKLLELIEEMKTERFGKEARISLCVEDLLLHLNRLTYERTCQAARSGEDSLYHRILAYVNDHIEEELSLDRLSETFYVSKYHIAHVFKHNFGMSIHQYITKKRLALCREAILGSLSITQACQDFGFGDYSSFYRAFKKEFGLSPKEFRELHTKLHPGTAPE